MTIITTSEDNMLCSISDGLQSDDQPVDYEIDMTDEWRQMKCDDAIQGRLDRAIAQMTKSNYIDFNDHKQLLKDCKRIFEQVEMPRRQAD